MMNALAEQFNASHIVNVLTPLGLILASVIQAFSAMDLTALVRISKLATLQLLY